MNKTLLIAAALLSASCSASYSAESSQCWTNIEHLMQEYGEPEIGGTPRECCEELRDYYYQIVG